MKTIMDSLIIYLIIGAIWLFQFLAKKKRQAEAGQHQEEKEPERGIFDELKDLLEKRYQSEQESFPKQQDLFEQAKQEIESQKAESVEEQETYETETVEAEEAPELETGKLTPLQPRYKEVLLKKIFDKYKPEAISPEPQVETPPVSYFLSDLSADVLEQGIILSAVLGPPKSVLMMRRINSDNY
ncbi:MAG: hypothetical protein AB1498_04565 [bacterium]